MSLEMDGEHRIPFILAHVHEHPVARDPGVVDEDVEAAERFERLPHHAPGRGEVRDVVAVRDRRAAGGVDFRNDLLRRRRVNALARQRRAEIVDDDPCARTRERECVLPADAAACAGDDRNLALE